MFRIYLLVDRLVGRVHYQAGTKLYLDEGIARRLVADGSARFVVAETETPVETATRKVVPSKAARTGRLD